MFERGRGQDLPGARDGLGAFNAVVEYVDYVRSTRNDKRAESLLFGSALKSNKRPGTTPWPWLGRNKRNPALLRGGRGEDKMKGRYHKLDGWRVSNPWTGHHRSVVHRNDGPAPLEDVQSEIVGFRLWLRTHGIRSRTKFGNRQCLLRQAVGCGKLDDFRRAAQLALDYLGSPNLVYLHSADQEEVLNDTLHNTKTAPDMFRDLVRRYYGKADGEKKPRRTHEEVVIAKESKARAVQARREFHERRRAARPKDAE